MRLAFIGFGEAGQAFATSLLEGGGHRIAAYDIKQQDGTDGDIRAAAARLGVTLASSPEAAIDGADWIFAAVTASSSLDAARSVAGSTQQGQVYFDINSVSPGRKRDAAEILPCDYIDMAVMAPVHPKGHATPVLLAGAQAEALAPALNALGFKLGVVSDVVGEATAVKMCRSLFVKGLEAITTSAWLASHVAGTGRKTTDTLEASYPNFDFPKLAPYTTERIVTHGVRRAAEMRECAVTMRELGLPEAGQLADAIAAVQDRLAGKITYEDGDYDKTIAALATALKA